MDLNAIATPSALYDAVMWMCLTITMLITLTLTAYYTRPPCARDYDVETGSYVQFSHSIELTTLTTMNQAEDSLRDSIPETSSFVSSMCATASHAGYADSEWSEDTDTSSGPSEEDITDVLSFTAMLGELPGGFPIMVS